MIKTGAITFAILLVLYSCKSKKMTETAVQVQPESICDSMRVGYLSHVKPIIDVHCVEGCHNAKKRAAGIDLSTVEKIRYEATGVRFMGCMYHEEYFSPMPKNKPKLADSTLLTVKCWIENGMLL